MLIDRKYFLSPYVSLLKDFGIATEKDIIVPPHIPFKVQFDPNESYSSDEIAESISYYYHKENTNIIFDSSPEGLNISFLQPMDEIVKKLVNNFNVPVEKITYVASALPIPANLNEYYNYCKRNSFIPVKIVLTNLWELHAGGNGQEFKDKILPFKTTQKNKKFISFNGVPRVHRVYCAMLLFEKNLISDSYYSLLSPKNYNMYDATFFGKKYFPGLTDRVNKQISKHKNKFPMVLTKPANLKPTEGQFVYEKDLDLMADVYFNLIQETNFLTTEDHEGFNTSLSIFISEKTWRTMIFQLPFITLNKPNTLSGLKEYGYKTFSPIFDESYDSIMDDTARLLAVIREVERLYKLSDKEWLTIQSDLNKAAVYNYEKIFSATPFTLKGTP